MEDEKGDDDRVQDRRGQEEGRPTLFRSPRSLEFEEGEEDNRIELHPELKDEVDGRRGLRRGREGEKVTAELCISKGGARDLRSEKRTKQKRRASERPPRRKVGEAVVGGAMQ